MGWQADIGYFGLLCSLLALNYFTLKNFSLKNIYTFFHIIALILGVVLICFTAYKSILLAFIILAFILLLVNQCYKTWIGIIKGIIVITIIIVVPLFVGNKEPYHHVVNRIKQFISTIHSDIEIVQDISKQDISKQDIAKQDIAKQDIAKQDMLSSLGIIRHPYTAGNTHTTYKLIKNTYKEWYKKTQKINMRITFYYCAYKLLIDNSTNALLGYSDNFLVDIEGNICIIPIHSWILSHILLMGFIGGGVLLLLIIRGISDSIKIMRREPELNGLWLFFGAACITGITDGMGIFSTGYWCLLAIMDVYVKRNYKRPLECVKNTTLNELKKS
jgi:hypothetical protein